MRIRYCLLAGLALLLLAPVGAQEEAVPQIPSLEEVQTGRARIDSLTPVNYGFAVGVVGEYAIELDNATGNAPVQQVKTPLVLINPRTAGVGVYARNFPARVLAQSRDGEWLIGVAPSPSVEGSSGNRNNECAVSLNLVQGGVIRMIEEFPLHSTFQAVFDPDDDNAIYYCVNEPAAVNKIIRYHLESGDSKVVNAEGNRFYIYGLNDKPVKAAWVADPLASSDFPVASLIDLKTGAAIDHAEFPGATQLLASPDGSMLLVVVTNSAEASIGWYDIATHKSGMVPGLVLTRPTFKWLNKSRAVIARESTTVRDRFLYIDLDTGEVRELYNAMFKIGQWDISDEDDALAFVTASAEPTLFVVPLTADNKAVQQIRLTDVTNVSWIGCIDPPPSGKSWLEKLLPF